MAVICYAGGMRKIGHDLTQYSKEDLDKLRSRIENTYEITENYCWEWKLSKSSLGYGRVKFKKHHLTVHRVYYQLINGPVAPDMVVDHLCENPPCINPDHLEPVTQWENNARGRGISAQNLRKTHCVKGHEYTPENTIVGKNRRSCRKCSLAVSSRRDKQRTKEYNARGLNSKGKPLKRIMPYWHNRED